MSLSSSLAFKSTKKGAPIERPSVELGQILLDRRAGLNRLRDIQPAAGDGLAVQ